MSTDHSLRSLPDDELLCRLSGLVSRGRRNEAELVAHLAEVDERRLYARSAAPSLFAYCTDVLHFSEPEACLRIAVARASKRHPVLLTMLAEGRIHLSGIATLAPHLTAENQDVLLARANHRSKRQIEELVAALSPRPDVSDRIRRLPEPRQTRPQVPQPAPSRTAARTAGASEAREAGRLPRLDEVVLPAVGESDSGVARPQDESAARHDRAARSASVDPIAAGRYKVQFTASAQLRDKLERVQALMQASHAQASLAAVIEAAVDDKLARLEAKRFGRTDKPRKTVAASDARPSSRYIPAAIRRAVWRRDQGRCRFVDEEGRRCTARRGLEFHHLHPFGLGGDHAVEGLRLYCGTHNRYVAEIDYGRRLLPKQRLEAPSPETPSP